ncbi:DNA replication/repair protein RecF [Helcococcus sueciensis]|uniref:DNA replication/repair protein RecF n=1 Tax=Helcococcus sueciensis TaxID=241555 RepID=UPI0004131B23|nr:DNA replication/repair protein RecF [Helcococcus sueciensis]
MIIEELRLINHRNYDDENINFHDKTNILVGKNAQGKTNLLEAIYICARGYSFKNLKENELINFDKNQMYLKAKIKNKDKKRTVEIKISRNDKKIIRINEVNITNLMEMKSQFGVVIFAPEEILIIKENPALRRKFIDDIISNNDNVYKKYLNNFYKIRSQKNELLKNRNSKYFDQMLDTYNQKLIEYSALIGIYRYKYLEILKKYASKFHYELSSGHENLQIIYDNNFSTNFENIDRIKKEFREILEKNREKEIIRGQSIYGPHKDDIVFLINDNDAKVYGSQGQQRTIMLSLKLAEAKLIEEITKTKPILLWDDVFSELDNQRATLLVERSKAYQNIITTNSLLEINTDNLDGEIFTIIDGKVINERNKNGKK